jgi:hypothetical protein
MILERERELTREHIKKVGMTKILVTYLLVLCAIVIVEAFASLNIYLLNEAEKGVPLLREIFSALAIIIASFTVIANIVFLGGKSKADREFHYYFRTRPLLLYSFTAIAGDIFAVFLAHNTGFPYIVFFTSLIALNLFAIGFAIYSTEKALNREINHR